VLLIETLAAGPHYLSFFNRASGGWQNGHRYLVDSSNDWGQDLPQLARWMAENQKEQQSVFLSYFGTADPFSWNVKARPLPSFPNAWHHPQDSSYEPGDYVISASMLQCVYCGPFSGPWNDEKKQRYLQLMDRSLDGDPAAANDRVWARFARLMNKLRKRPPDDFAAPSMPVYKLSESDLLGAGLGQQDQQRVP
jgi:hypothetical protein